mmetsp:Transcript_7198/g.26957  ORF Transcript_7198/g.26957 Transcript_7198/m.26957 type:complete len:145 (-) Transcript_7198:1419-1853(-)
MTFHDPLLNPKSFSSNQGTKGKNANWAKGRSGRTMKANDEPKGKQKTILEEESTQDRYRKSKDLIQKAEQTKLHVQPADTLLEEPHKSMSKSKRKRILQQQKDMPQTENDTGVQQEYSHDNIAENQGSMSFLLPKKQKTKKEWE